MNFVTDLLGENAAKQKYDLLSSGKFAHIPYPISFIPAVTSTDAYVIRYFVKKLNEKFIYEVGLVNYNSLMSSTFYNHVSLSWQVRGVKNSIADPSGDIIGVAEYNLSQIALAENSVPGLARKLINPLELYQGLN